MVLFIAALLYLFDRAFRRDFDLHLFAHLEQEFTGILHSPSHIGNGKLRGCRDRAAATCTLSGNSSG